MKVVIFLILIYVRTHSFSSHETANLTLNNAWKLFKTEYGKRYDPSEEHSRRLIWERNIQYIQEHNIRYNLGQFSYYLGVNKFADMTIEEYRMKYLRPFQTMSYNQSIVFMPPLSVKSLPDNVNWVTEGYVTAIKDQGDCGSCYAFSAIGAVEGQYFRTRHQLVNMSEQQVVDCARAFGSNGCSGGVMDQVFRYLMAYGIETNKDYPYTQDECICVYNRKKVVAKVTGYVDIEVGNENSLAIAVATQGPVSVGIDSGSIDFLYYKGGVYDNPNCSNQLDHGVVVVGYGIEDGKKYWLVKNSYGTSWGMKGYIMMSKDKDNQCGIASLASYPTM